MAEPTTQLVADKLTEALFFKLMETKCYDLIPPGQAKGVFESILRSNSVIGKIEGAQKVGRAFSAQTVLMGYTYRWKDREGTDYAVKRPSSVAFDLYLVRVETGAILWKGKYDKTQQSLSENLLDMDTFLKGKGKWMTVDKLAEIGLNSILQQFPKGTRVRES